MSPPDVQYNYLLHPEPKIPLICPEAISLLVCDFVGLPLISNGASMW
jgi:hypothetical protein